LRNGDRQIGPITDPADLSPALVTRFENH
jgi:hypothetical protein